MFLDQLQRLSTVDGALEQRSESEGGEELEGESHLVVLDPNHVSDPSRALCEGCVSAPPHQLPLAPTSPDTSGHWLGAALTHAALDSRKSIPRPTP